MNMNRLFPQKAQLSYFLLPALLTFSLLIGGCSKPVSKNAFLDFSINPQQNGIYSDGETGLITARDKRKEVEVITYFPGSNQPIRINADPSINSILTKQLANGFKDQGLILTQENPQAHINLEIIKLQADIVKDKGLYLTKVHTTLQFTVETTLQKLTKTYKRDADRKNISKPALQDIEVMIREQMQEIINLILINPEIVATIKKTE
jgi:uncharacterized lipoprotein YajG